MSCVCDDFQRSSLNPSPINGGNWTLSATSGTFGVPQIVNSGYLRLTDNSISTATSATMPGIFPGKGNLITIDFKYYAYCGSTTNTCGGDGSAFVLSDASVAPVAGGNGSSLGYSQKNNTVNGFDGGWMGVGIDEFGNYPIKSTGRDSGVASAVPDSVSVRGSGSGSSSATTNYPYLTGTSTLLPGIDDPSSTAPSWGHAYRITVDARCYEANTNNAGLNCNNASLAKKAQVTIYRDTTGAGNFSATNKLLDFDMYALNPSQASVPSDWLLSFTSSSGSVVNIHEIKELKVCAASITRPPSIAVDDYAPSTCASAVNGKTTVTITGLTSNGSTDTGYAKTIVLSADFSDGSLSDAVWSKKGANGELDADGSIAVYTFAAADQGVATFYLSDSTQEDVYLTVYDADSFGISSSLSSPVKFSGSSFAITAADSLSTGVVAGRNHLMSITRKNDCSTDTSYTGSKNLDGWYTPDTNHPSGANAPQICATNASGACLASAGTCQALSVGEPSVNSTSNNLPALTFTNGVANFCLAPSDVGKYSVSMRDDVTSTTSQVTGTTTTLTARPFAIVVSGIANGTRSNQATTTASGNYFAAAGSSFIAAVGGYRWNSAGDANGDGLPDSSASFAQLTGGGLASHYADTVTLSPTLPIWPTGGTTGALSNGTISVISGSGSTSTLSYSEVGSFSLGVAPSTDYLGSGISLSNRVAVFANPTDTSTQTKVIGRFIPDRFALSAGTLTPACTLGSTRFTYVGQPMTTAFTLMAQNAQGATTTNYAGSFARLDISTGSAFSFGAIDGTTNLTSRLDSTAAPSGSWNAGIAAVSQPIKLTRGTTPDKPYTNLLLGINPVDADGVALQTSALSLDTDGTASGKKAQIGSAGTVMRFGRLKLFNAFGSSASSLDMSVQTQYWTGNSWLMNADDSCTQIPSTAIGKSNYLDSKGDATTAWSVTAGTVSLGSGAGKIVLTKSPAAGTGSVNICVDLGSDPATGTACPATSASMSYLQGKWPPGTSYDNDPSARASFGVYSPETKKAIHVREIF